ncbi:MAG: MMPL family transporter [Acidobacteriota bacterium]
MLGSWIARRRRAVLGASLGLGLLALLPASRLRPTADLVSLLPSDVPAAADYGVFLETFGGLEKVFILVTLDQPDGDPRRALLRAAEALGQRLDGDPEVADVRTGLSAEDEDFALAHVVARAPLLISDEALEARLDALSADGGLEARAESLRRELTGPTAPTRRPLRRHDPLGFADDLDLLTDGGLPIDPLTGAFLAPDGAASLVIVVPTRSELDPEGGRVLLAALDAAFADVAAELRRTGDPELLFQAVGGPLYAAQDEMLIRRDLELTIAGSVAGCALLLLLAFRGVAVPGAALAAIVLALLWTGALLATTLGEVTAIGLGFAAVLVGLGIDYGIHGGVRFRAARLAGADAASAVDEVFRRAGPGIATSAATTAAAFATLGAAHFRPLRELGLVVALGIVAILVASASFGAAALASLPSSGTPSASSLWRGLGGLVDGCVELAERRPRAVLVGAALLTAVSVWGAARLELSADLRALRPADHPALAAEEALAGRFGLGLDTSTVVVRGASLGETLARSEGARDVLEDALRAELGRSAAGWSLTSPTDWLAAGPRIDARRAALAEDPRLAQILDGANAALADANLAPRAFAPGLEALDALRRGVDPAPPDPTTWPRSIAELVRLDAEATREERVAAALRLRLPKDTWPTGPPAEVLAALDDAAPGVAIASVPRIAGELRRLARGDLATLAEVALLMVGLVVAVSFRGRISSSLLALLPVTLGTLWALGLWGAGGGGLDLLSLSVVPILLGIGIDDGLHALHAAGKDRPLRNLASGVREAGLAMALTTATTTIGFSSLTVSSIPGLARGGALVSLGVVACLAATLLVLPALGALATKR